MAEDAFTGTFDPNGAFNPFSGSGFAAPVTEAEEDPALADSPFPTVEETEPEPVNPGLPGDEDPEAEAPPAQIEMPFAQDIEKLSEDVRNLHTLMAPYELLWSQVIKTKKSLLRSPSLGQVDAQKTLNQYQTLMSLDLDLYSYDRIHERIFVEIDQLKETYKDIDPEQLLVLQEQSQQLKDSIAGIQGRARLILNIAYRELENGFANFSPSAPMVYEQIDQKDWRREFFEAGLLVVLKIGDLIDQALNLLSNDESRLSEPAIAVIETARSKIEESQANQTANVLREWMECSLGSHDQELSYCSISIH